MIKKIAILTSGGDAPGMNNAVRAITKRALAKGLEPYLVIGGYKGLYDFNMVKVDEIDLDGSISRGGTVILSSRFPEFANIEFRKKAVKKMKDNGFDALVVIGGDGSYKGAQALHELGVKTVAIPGTIDNDITSSDLTIGYDTALNTIVESVGKIRDTMNSHARAAIVEVMGHGCGDLALYSALATGAEIVVTNENKKSAAEIAAIIKEQVINKKKPSAIAIVSEFIFDDLKKLEKEVSEKSGVVTRAVSLGHIQRGGVPTAMERVNASLMGMKAIDFLLENKSGIAIGILDGKIKSTPILEALEIKQKNKASFADEVNNLNQA